MPTATTEIPAETVTFHSISPNQVLTRRAERHVDNGLGGKEVLTEGEWFQRMEDKGEDFDRTPWKVEFVNHIFSTDDQTLIEWLRGHPKFNIAGTSGFYESGAAPDEPKPTINEQMARISTAGVQLEVDALQELIESEKAEHNRPSILQAAEAALRAIESGAPEPGADAGSGDGDPESTFKP